MRNKEYLSQLTYKLKERITNSSDFLSQDRWIVTSATPLTIGVIMYLLEIPPTPEAMNLTLIPITHTVTAMTYRLSQEMSKTSR